MSGRTRDPINHADLIYGIRTVEGHNTEPINNKGSPHPDQWGKHVSNISPINHKARLPHSKHWGNETVDSPIKIDGLKTDGKRRGQKTDHYLPTGAQNRVKLAPK